MYVRVDEAAEGEGAFAIDTLDRLAAEVRLDGRDPPVPNGDINERAIFFDADIADDEIEQMIGGLAHKRIAPPSLRGSWAPVWTVCLRERNISGP
jgi:hypothetical protein